MKINEIFKLAVKNHKENKLEEAKDLYNQILIIDPEHTHTQNNLGIIFEKLKDNEKAKNYFEKAIETDPNYVDAYNNLGNVLKAIGDIKKAQNCYKKAIAIDPSYVNAHHNLGASLNDLSDFHKAKDCYKKAIEIDPNYAPSYWNLHSLSSNIDEALTILQKLYEIDSGHTNAEIMISILQCYKGNLNRFKDLLKLHKADHPFVRSAKWVFSLPKLPNIFFNRLHFFDAVIALSDNSRPFYEFGVWKGVSFQHLIKNFKKGFGFDTFTGLPETWHNEKKGHYSSFGLTPKIEGGQFITGKFEDTLPNFFSKERPLASLINFDADLYSSTLCALNYSNKVIDEKTILIFDEFIMNDRWEEDEYKALNEFCDNLGYSYEVIAVSFFTKQVAVKLKKLSTKIKYL